MCSCAPRLTANCRLWVWYQSCTKWSRVSGTIMSYSLALSIKTQGQSVVEGSTSGQLWLNVIGGDFLPIISHITTVSPCPVVTVLVRESVWGGVCQRYCMLGSRFLSLIYNLYLPVARINFFSTSKKVANVNFPQSPITARPFSPCRGNTSLLGADQLSMI